MKTIITLTWAYTFPASLCIWRAVLPPNVALATATSTPSALSLSSLKSLLAYHIRTNVFEHKIQLTRIQQIVHHSKTAGGGRRSRYCTLFRNAYQSGPGEQRPQQSQHRKSDNGCDEAFAPCLARAWKQRARARSINPLFTAELLIILSKRPQRRRRK